MNPADVLISIGYNLPDERKSFIRGTQELHRFFYRAKTDHSELLNQFMFNTNGTYPLSEELEQAIGNCVASGMLVCLSSNPNHYHFDPNAVRESYEKHISKRIDESKKKELSDLAERFNEEIARPIIFGFV